MIYLDNSATTRPYDGVVNKINDIYKNNFGNPSSVHALGIAAEAEVRAAREQLSSALSCRSEELYFTSGGTESNNLATMGAVNALRRRGNRIVTTNSEHPAILEPMKALKQQGFEVVTLSTQNGMIHKEELFSAINADTILVSMMLVNNETGAIYPVSLVKAAIEQAKAPALLHCDCVQAFCKIPFSVQSLKADLITLSSHKIHGPKGCGALYVRKGVRIVPPYLGGGQEKGLRSGTENVPCIAGFGEAVRIFEENKQNNYKKLSSLKQMMLSRLKYLPGLVIHSSQNSAPHILSLAMPGIRSEVLLRFLEHREIYVSAGSACASNKKGSRSHVLTAFGLAPELIDSTIRISLSHENTEKDLDALAAGLDACYNTMVRGSK